MKIVYMGTPEFAVPPLEALLDAGYQVAEVFTQPDKPKNRGMKLLPPPVKEAALKRGIPVWQPVSMRDGQALQRLQAMAPDLAVVAAYGRILPREILELPRLGCINIHASLLPRHRGASPINAAVLCGDRRSGVTIQQMAEGIDTGDMLCSIETPIGVEETFGSLHDRLKLLGAQALLDAVEQLNAGTARPEAQEDSAATYAPLIRNADVQVDFSRPAEQVSCLIRAYDPVPGAFCVLGGGKLKLYGALGLDRQACGSAGTIAESIKDGLIVNCGEKCVLIREVQGSGGKRMSADAYFRGHSALLSQKFELV